VLDEIDELNEIDKSNMLSFCVKAPYHYREAARLASDISVDFTHPTNIVVCGMGGSAIGGELLKDWAREEASVSIEVNREYSLPAYVSENTLVLIVSYSGETEETLSAFLDALRKKCMIFCISSGGSVLEFAKKLKVPYLQVPAGMPPRAALPYLFVPSLMLLEMIHVVSNVSEEFSEAISILESISKANSSSVPERDNFCKKVALAVNDSVPVVYGFGVFRSVAQRMKQQFNENSKVPSKWEYFSELDHNEVVGWEAPGNLALPFSAIFFRDKFESDAIRSRIETTKGLMKESISKMVEVWSLGKSKLARMLSLVCLGDFSSVYLAVLRGVDPTPVLTIDHLKKEIGKKGARERIIGELKGLS
jgi:glucose/mannose-6-phosphate isomerase